MKTRRKFLKKTAYGLATFGALSLILRAEAEPTPPSGSQTSYSDYLLKEPIAEKTGRTVISDEMSPTEDNILGPYHREGAPFRAKVTPPLAEGVTLVVSGRVWGYDTKKPLANAVIHIWHADHHGRYDNDGSKTDVKLADYKNRARIVTDERRYYEYEAIHPGRYKLSASMWRPAHIHYMIQKSGYKTLVTQLYFEGDPHNDKDPFIKKSLIIPLKKVAVKTGQTYERGTFDIVLAKS